jgi:uncharacterized secreted protein with C-terminal beta-propeller domain
MSTRFKIFNAPKTHIAQVRIDNDDQLNEVCQLFGWSRDKYCEHQFAIYQKLVAELCKDWPRVKIEVEYSPVFRGFFNNEWNLRNETEFLPMAYDFKYDPWYITKEYLLIHDHERLLNDDNFMRRYAQIMRMI